MKKQLHQLSLAMTILSLLLSGCNLLKQGGSPDAAGDTLSARQITLDQKGGEYKLKDLSLSISANNLAEPAKINLQEFEGASTNEDPLVAAQSNVYTLEDLPADFQGTLQLTLAIPQSLLDTLDTGDPSQAEKLVLWMGGTSFVPSEGGAVTTEQPLEARVDLQAKTATARVDLDGTQAASTVRKLAATIPAPLYDEEWMTTHNFYFQLRSYNDYPQVAESKNFIARIFPKLHGETIAPLMDALEWNKTQIESLGWNFGPHGPSNKFPVVVENCDYHAGYDHAAFLGKIGLGSIVNVDGQYRYNPVMLNLDNGASLCINTRLMNGDPKTLNAVVGHELMHYYQNIVYFARPYSVWKNYLTLDEAISMWYERTATEDENWLPKYAADYSYYPLYNPWFYSPASRDIGYSLSWFIHYLVNEYGTAFIQGAYHCGADDSITALAKGLKMTNSADLAYEYLNFLPTYLFKTEEISPTLRADPTFQSILTKAIALEASGSGNQVSLDFKTVGEPKFTTSGNMPGMLQPDGLVDPQPSVSVSYSPGGMSAYYFSLGIKDPGGLITQPGRLSISVSSPGSAGVMVFGLKGSSPLSAAEPIAGPDSYLSGGGTSYLDVDDFGAGAYPRVGFLLFNLDNGPENKPADINLYITYNQMPSVYFWADARAEQWMYDENICYRFNPPGGEGCCAPFPDPCPSSSGGGGGGGGGGDGYEGCPPCLNVPDWCFTCCSAPGGANYNDYARDYGDQYAAFSIEITVNGKGEIETIGVVNIPYMSNAPAASLSLSQDGSHFRAEWQNLWDNYNNQGYLILEGDISTTEGSGTWTLGHNGGAGDLIKGSWVTTIRR
jgi:hypothetical protein